MFNLFDQSLPYAYSFNEKHSEERELFRHNVLGGLTNIYHRHINTIDEKSAPASRIAPNKDPFNHVTFLDFNSMVSDIF